MCPNNTGFSSEFIDDENEVEYLNFEIDNLESEYLDMEIDRDYWKNKYLLLLEKYNALLENRGKE